MRPLFEFRALEGGILTAKARKMTLKQQNSRENGRKKPEHNEFCRCDDETKLENSQKLSILTCAGAKRKLSLRKQVLQRWTIEPKRSDLNPWQLGLQIAKKVSSCGLELKNDRLRWRAQCISPAVLPHQHFFCFERAPSAARAESNPWTQRPAPTGVPIWALRWPVSTDS